MKKLAKKKNVIIPKEWIDESVYRQIQFIQEAYRFESVEYTINVIMDFMDSNEQRTAFHEHVKKQFPSKF